MAWKTFIAGWDEDEAEIRVYVTYYNDIAPGVIMREERIVRPAGTPEARIYEEIGRLGRSARAEFAKQHADENPNVGKVFPIDDL